MNTIECKAQWLVRPMSTKASMEGFEGPAPRTDVDDGFGNVMVKGQRTATFNTFFKMTGYKNGQESYDGTIEIYDTKFNREKIAAHVRSRDLRVVDRALEKEILAANPPGARRARVASAGLAEMPEDFDGSKVAVRPKAMIDEDPVEDPFAADAEFTEVPKAVAAVAEEPEPVVVKKLSVEEQKAGKAAPQATKPPAGVNPRAGKKLESLVPDVE